MSRKIQEVLDVELQDDPKVSTGGVSFEGERVRDFIGDSNLTPEDDLSELNKRLKESGIKEVH